MTARAPHTARSRSATGAARVPRSEHKLVADALAAHAREAGRRADGRLRGRRIGQQVEHARQPGQPEHAQRVVVERRRRAQAQAAGGEVVEAAERVDDGVAVERAREGVDGDVARPEVRLQAEGARGRVRGAARRPAA